MCSHQRKRRILAILVPMQTENIETHTDALSAFSISFHWQTIFRKIPHRSVSSSTILNTLRLKHFPLTHIPESINSELRATQVRHGRNATYEPGLNVKPAFELSGPDLLAGSAFRGCEKIDN